MSKPIKMIVEHTTGVINFTIPNFLIDETDCKRFVLTDRVIDVHSNHIHIGSVKKSIKKRKPQIYRKKRSGDPEAFDSQVQISIRSLMDESKLYKIKVFRNGSGVVPGVLAHSLVDVREPLEELGRYLSKIYERDIKCENIRGVTHNYKMRTTVGVINMRKLCVLLEEFHVQVYTMSLTLLEQYLSAPIIKGERISWCNILMNDSPIVIDTEECINCIMHHKININKKSDKLEYRFIDISRKGIHSLVNSDALARSYKSALNFIKNLIVNYNCIFSDDDIRYYMLLVMKKYIDNNSHIWTNVDYFRYYMNDRITKLTVNIPSCSIVFYTSGKINIHGISDENSLNRVIFIIRNILERYAELYPK